MTTQEIFDTVYLGLKGQGFERSVRAIGHAEFCAWRGDGGRKCAIGHLIRDEEYHPDMDESSEFWSLLSVTPIDRLQLIYESQCTKDGGDEFWDSLQGCHDLGKSPEAMDENLREFAKARGLTVPA